MDNDQWMIAQIKRRNEAGLKQLIDKYTGLLKSIIQKTMAYLPQYQEECLNDVLLAIWNNIDNTMQQNQVSKIGFVSSQNIAPLII